MVIDDLNDKKVVTNDMCLEMELEEYKRMVRSPYHEDRKSNFYYMRHTKYLEKRINNAIKNKGII